MASRKPQGPQTGWAGGWLSLGAPLVAVPSFVLEEMDTVGSFQKLCLIKRTFLFEVTLAWKLIYKPVTKKGS